MTFKTSRTILYGDCDPAGFVYTPRVAHLLIEAALEFLSDILGGSAARDFSATGVLPPARSLSIDFLHPMVWDDQIEVEVTVNEIRAHSFSTLLIARNAKGDITFRAVLAQVCVSLQNKRPVPLPARLRAALVQSQAANRAAIDPGSAFVGRLADPDQPLLVCDVRENGAES